MIDNILAAVTALYPWCKLWSPANIPNWCLMLVGLGGTVAALMTLSAIRDQAGKMAEQTRQMAEQVSATKEANHELMKASLLERRPKIVVRILTVHPSTVATMNGQVVGKPVGQVAVELANVGGSIAKITEVRVAVERLREHEPIPVVLPSLQYVDSTPLSEGRSVVLNVRLNEHTNEIVRRLNLAASGNPVYKTTDGALFVAIINYIDSLDIPRTTRAWRIYDAKKGTFVRVDDSDREFAD